MRAAGKPSPPKQDSRGARGGRLSPECAKYANNVTTDEVPMMFPFVATAAGTEPSLQPQPRLHTPEAPRQMSRITPASMARRWAEQRGEGVEAAMHAHAGAALPSPSVSETHTSETAVLRPAVDALVAQHVSAAGGYGAGQAPAGVSDVRAALAETASRAAGHARSDTRSMRAPYAMMGDTGSQESQAEFLPERGYGLRSQSWVPQDQAAMLGAKVGDEGGRFTRGTDRGASQRHGHVPPDWMHVDRPAGVTTAGAARRGEVWGSQPHTSGGRAAAQAHDQVGKILQHSEATLRTSPGGEMFGMIDELSRKYGAQSLK